MQLVKYTRPKLPRNKYGINNTTGFMSSGIFLEGENIETGTSTDNSSSTTTNVTNIYYTEEWYNIQNKIVHSYENSTDSDGNIIYVNRLDSQGNYMYYEDGEIMKVPQLDYLDSTWITVIENFNSSSKLRNNNEYRFMLMRFRKHKREGKRWRIPWFSPKYQKTGDGVQNIRMDIAEQDCWWSVQGSESKWWNDSQKMIGTETDDEGNEVDIYRNKNFKDVLPVAGDHLKQDDFGDYYFRNTPSRTMIVGCALFKKTNTGAFGWKRVSNIATMKIKLTKTGSYVIDPNA